MKLFKKWIDWLRLMSDEIFKIIQKNHVIELRFLRWMSDEILKIIRKKLVKLNEIFEMNELWFFWMNWLIFLKKAFDKTLEKLTLQSKIKNVHNK